MSIRWCNRSVWTKRFLLWSLLLVCMLWYYPAVAAEQQLWGLMAMQPGQRLVAKLQYINQSHSDLRPVFQDLKQEKGGDVAGMPAPGMVRTVQADLHGLVEFTMLYQADSGAVLQVRLNDLHSQLRIDGRRSDTSDQAVKMALKAGMWLRLGHNGTLEGIWFGREPDRISRSLLTTVAALLQLSAPTGVNQTAWEQEEQDQAGRYLAAYQLKDADVWQKQKKQYLYDPAVDASKTRQVNYQPQGGLLIHFAVDHLVQTISGSEQLDLYVGERHVGRSETQFRFARKKLDRLSNRRLAEQRQRFEQATRGVAPQQVFRSQDQEESNRLLYRQKLGGQTLDELLQALQTAEQMPAGYDDTELYLKFKALIYLQPQTSKVLAQVVVAAKPRSRSFRLLVSALSGIGHQDAQDALLTIIAARSADIDTLVELLPLLGMFDRPTAAVETTLLEYAYKNSERDVNFTAQLALGALAGKIASRDVARAHQLLDSFVSRYRHVTTADDISRVVLVLGNAGLPAYLPLIQSYLQDPRGEVRADAVHALRRFPLASVTEPLMASLVHDKDSSVRYEAANALGYHTLSKSLLMRIQDYYRIEPIARVRLEILKTLWSQVKQNPELLTFVNTVAETDPSDDVRKTAKGLLGK